MNRKINEKKSTNLIFFLNRDSWVSYCLVDLMLGASQGLWLVCDTTVYLTRNVAVPERIQVNPHIFTLQLSHLTQSCGKTKLLREIYNVGIFLNAGASRDPQGDEIRCMLLVLTADHDWSQLDHQDRSWVNADSFLPARKQLEALMIPSLGQKLAGRSKSFQRGMLWGSTRRPPAWNILLPPQLPQHPEFYH